MQLHLSCLCSIIHTVLEVNALNCGIYAAIVYRRNCKVCDTVRLAMKETLGLRAEATLKLSDVIGR